ncbi:NUDIX domain-containing protein [Streptomyces platensis]|uniref:NUDIX domain-containing protein n=1 Tax=Streptomyces platensis TaxID=58346 RepID=UPI002E257BE9|nr:NUDIX domain-containing protein [Streptomyces platensis]
MLSPPPGRGRLALPWGYLEVGESWREAAVRELREETGLMASAHGVRLFAAHSTRNTLEVFALLPTRAAAGLPEMARTTETQGCCVLSEAVELAFPDTPRPWPLPWPDARCSPP